MYCFQESLPASRPPPVAFSPPKAPPISAPFVGMFTFTIPQSLPCGLHNAQMHQHIIHTCNEYSIELQKIFNEIACSMHYSDNLIALLSNNWVQKSLIAPTLYMSLASGGDQQLNF